MALTKEFRETVYDRAQHDSKFRKALLTEAVNAYLNGDEGTGKAVLRDVINATIGFEKLAADLKKPSKQCGSIWRRARAVQQPLPSVTAQFGAGFN
jgi:hypothetical protein